MQEKNVTVLDFTGCKHVADLHDRIREALHFPEWYGRNWSAFWDCLSMELSEEYTNLEVRGLNSLPADLKSSREKIIEIMQRNKEYYDKQNEKHPDYDYRFEYRIID